MASSATLDVDDDQVEFFADGQSEAVEARAENCEHRVYHWTLDQDAEEWRKECIFCPAVLETQAAKDARDGPNGGDLDGE